MLEKTRLWQRVMKLSKVNSENGRDEALEKTKMDIPEMVRDQLAQGEDSKSQELNDYSRASVEIYGKPEGAMVMRDTGGYYQSIFTELDNENIVINSQPNKEDTDIEWEYGYQWGLIFLGLQDDNLEIIQKKTKDELIAQVRELLNLDS